MPLTGRGSASGTALHGSAPQTGGRLCAVLVAVSLVLLTVSYREGGTGILEGARFAFQTITSPVRYFGGLVSAPFSALGNVVANLTASQETLSELREENERLRAENVELAESAQMAERLEALLQLRSVSGLKSTGARVISGSVDSWTSTITIDKGSASGVAVGMPVADEHGAIGQVIEVSATSAVVRLLADENSSVSAMVQASRAQGALDGSADGTLRLTMIRTDQTVNIGDNVVTSGLGGVFPKGLALGRVTSVEKTPGALYYDIVVEPLASLESFEEVLVITSLTEGQQATADDIASADAQETTGSGGGQQDAEGADEGGEDEGGEL